MTKLASNVDRPYQNWPLDLLLSCIAAEARNGAALANGARLWRERAQGPGHADRRLTAFHVACTVQRDAAKAYASAIAMRMEVISR